MLSATGSCRKTTEIVGTSKKYSDRKLSGFFAGDSCRLPVLYSRNRPEIIGENPEDSRPKYYIDKITRIPQNRPFPRRAVKPAHVMKIAAKSTI
jgi:hypothetical protein